MTKWSGADDFNALGSGLSSLAPAGLTSVQLAAYLTQVRLDEINRLLKLNGNLNKAALEKERAALIEAALKHNPEMFSIGSAGGSKASVSAISIPGVPSNCRFAEKIYLPARDYSDINFVGLLIGPRGNTLRKMENETGAKISIRGRGAQKDSRLMDAAMLAAADEELHAVVMADTQEKFDRAVSLINRIVETACSTPEQANELKKVQLRELAMLNGTLPLESATSAVCALCGQSGHQRYECKQALPLANRVLCRVCGGAGHTASDCIYKNDPGMLQQSMVRADQIDEEYAQFMTEINNDGREKKPEAPKPSNPWAAGLQADNE